MYCLVSQYQKGGAREAEAGNHPRGEGGEAEGRQQTKSGWHLSVSVAYLEEEEAVSVTQKRCRAVGSVSADPQREDEISAPTEADNVPLVTRRKCCSVVLGDGCRFPESVVWKRGASQLFFISQRYKMWTKSLMMCTEYSSNSKGNFSHYQRDITGNRIIYIMQVKQQADCMSCLLIM